MLCNRILYVEDSPLCSLVNSAVMRDGGFDVLEVCCGADAVAVLDRHDPLAALVTDINLGGGLDGFEVSRLARAAYPGLTVIYVSAAAAARVPFEGVRDAEFIAKPFHPRQIVEALDRAVNLEAALAQLDSATLKGVWARTTWPKSEPISPAASAIQVL